LCAVAIVMTACVPPNGAPAPSNANGNGNTNQAASTSGKPAIDVSPTTGGPENWKIASADTVTVSVTAPGAETVNLLYRPTSADEDEFLRLKNNVQATDKTAGKFSAQMKLPEDFAGDLWAEATYAGGRKEQTEPVALRRGTANPDAAAGTTPDAAGGATPAPDKASPEVSAVSDSVTGGKIETATLAKNDPDLKITINIPAFQLLLWQSGKLVKTYSIGIGQKKYPLPESNRVAREIVLNPDWVPPDSDWVRAEHVTPGEPIEASDPKNPLGDIKIPLGDGILIHEGKPSNLGNLVSHGCARLTEPDLLDLADNIVAAQGIAMTPDEIKKIAAGDERKNIGLKKPIPVEISYDTAVVQGGKLYLYPDVYEKGTATVQAVRAELQQSGLDASTPDDAAIGAMLERVDRQKAFVVAVADLKAGKGVQAGTSEPVVARNGATTQGAKKGAKSKGGR